MTLADDLQTCLAELIGSPIPAVPDDSVEPPRFFRLWLAEHKIS